MSAPAAQAAGAKKRRSRVDLTSKAKKEAAARSLGSGVSQRDTLQHLQEAAEQRETKNGFRESFFGAFSRLSSLPAGMRTDEPVQALDMPNLDKALEEEPTAAPAASPAPVEAGPAAGAAAAAGEEEPQLVKVEKAAIERTERAAFGTTAPAHEATETAPSYEPKHTKPAGPNNDMLYVQAVASMRSYVGGSARVATAPQELTKYLQDCFGADGARHKAALAQAKSMEKKVMPNLRVTLKRAINLFPKDESGFSDPFCVLRILPSNAVTAYKPHSPKTKANDRPQHLDDGVYLSSVRDATLDPEWNDECFLFKDVDTSHILIVDVWDQDLGQGAINKIRNVRTLKGVGRLFKDLKQTLTSSSDDDFLGWVAIPLKAIPTVGPPCKYTLSPRTSKSNVRGDLVLGFQYEPSDQASAAKDHDDDVVRYFQLAETIVAHEIEPFIGQKDEEWEALSEQARVVLFQFAIQHGISSATCAIGKLQALSKVLGKARISALSVLKVLQDLADAVQAGAKFEKLEGTVADVLNTIATAYIDRAGTVMDSFKATEDGAYQCLYTVGSLLLISKIKAWRDKHSHGKGIHELLDERLAKHFTQRYQEIHNREDPLEDYIGRDVVCLVKICTALVQDIRTLAEIFENPFDTIKELNVTRVAIRTYDAVLAGRTKTVLESYRPKEDTDDLGTFVFELYFSLRSTVKQMKMLSSAKEFGELPLQCEAYADWFENFIVHWIRLSKINGRKWIARAIEIDEVVRVTGEVMHSSSVLDAFRIFSEIWEFWARLKWPNENIAPLLVTQIGEAICSCVQDYAFGIGADLEKKGFYDTEGQFDLSEKLCIVLNNLHETENKLEQIREYVGVDAADHAFLEKCGAAEDGKTHCPLYAIFGDAHKVVTVESKRLAEKTAERMAADIDGFLRRALTEKKKKESDPVTEEEAQVAVDPLLTYLNSNIGVLIEHTYTEVLDMMLIEMWEQVLQVLREIFVPASVKGALKLDKRQTELLLAMFKEIHAFFHQDGDGLSKTALEEADLAQTLRQLAEWSEMSADQLIAKFYLKHGENLLRSGPAETDAGTLQLQVSLSPRKDGTSNTLKITVVSGENLAPMDRNGLSDPFVILRMFDPKCSSPKEQKTSTQKKTLNPVFKESFEFVINGPFDEHTLQLVVVDKDFLASDTIGEVLLPVHVLATKKMEAPESFVIRNQPPTGSAWEAMRLLQMRAKTDRSLRSFTSDRERFLSAPDGKA